MNTHGRRVFLCALLAVMFSTAHGEALSVPRPDWKPGDRWKFERRDPSTKVVTGTTEEIVTGIEATRIDVTFNGVPRVRTPDFIILDTDRISYEGGYQFLQFPLDVGKKWDFKVKYRIKQAGTGGSGEFNVEVLGPEKVTVQAGTFDALKLQAKGSLTSTPSGTYYRVTIAYWYAPSVKRIIRSEWRDSKRDGDYDEELVEMKLAE